MKQLSNNTVINLHIAEAIISQKTIHQKSNRTLNDLQVNKVQERPSIFISLIKIIAILAIIVFVLTMNSYITKLTQNSYLPNYTPQRKTSIDIY